VTDTALPATASAAAERVASIAAVILTVARASTAWTDWQRNALPRCRIEQSVRCTGVPCRV